MSKIYLILTTGKRKSVDLLTKLTNKNYKLNTFETELVDLLTNLIVQKLKEKKFDYKISASKRIGLLLML